jgi:hypothetical protein
MSSNEKTAHKTAFSFIGTEYKKDDGDNDCNFLSFAETALENTGSLYFLFHLDESLWITTFEFLSRIKASVTFFIFDILSIEYSREISSGFKNAALISGEIMSTTDIEEFFAEDNDAESLS